MVNVTPTDLLFVQSLWKEFNTFDSWPTSYNLAFYICDGEPLKSLFSLMSITLLKKRFIVQHLPQ